MFASHSYLWLKTMPASEKARKNVAEWDDMYKGGAQPFGATSFATIDGLLKRHVPEGGVVLEIGSGYGRDAVFLAREKACSRYVAVEPGRAGTEACAKNAASAGLSGTIEAVCAFAEEYDFAPMRGSCDMVLMDSVLAFLDESIQPKVVECSLDSLKIDGHLVIIGWPKEDNVHWVAQLIRESSIPAQVTNDAEVLVTKASFDGEEVEMTWHVTIASRSD